MTNRLRTLETLAPFVAGLLLACPVLVAYYPPMTDLPYHEGAIGILRHFNDRSMFPPGLYVRNLGEPNQLFHMAGWALSYVVSTRWAVKLLVAAAVFALPVCAARLARHLGTSQLGALIVAPMALGWMFSWGLITNLIGLGVLLAVLPPLDRYAARPSPRGLLGCVGAILLLYLAHDAMLFAYAGAVLWLAVLHPLSRKETPLRAAPFGICVLITLLQLRRQKRFMTPAVRSVPVVWYPLKVKIARIPWIIAPATDRVVQLCVSLLCVAAIAAFFWLRTRERRRERALAAPEPDAPASRLLRARAWTLHHRWELFSAVAFACYLAFPFSLLGATLVYERWFPLAFAVIAVVVAPRDIWTPAGRLPRLVALALPAATLLVAWPSFVDSDRQFRALARLLPEIEPGSSVAALELGPNDRTRSFSLGPAAGRVLATRGGRLDYSFTDSPVSPVVITRKYQWQEELTRLAFDSWSFRPEHDFRRFRYLLVHSPDAGMVHVVTFALSKEGRYVDTAGEWALLESRLPVVSVLSRDVRMEDPPPESLRDRVRTIVKEIREAPAPGEAP